MPIKRPQKIQDCHCQVVVQGVGQMSFTKRLRVRGRNQMRLNNITEQGH